MRLPALTSLMLLVAGCEPSLPEPPGAADAGSDGGVVGTDGGTARIVTNSDGAGHFMSQVNAMDSKTFAALDLDTASDVPFEGNQWDLAFQRFHIRARGGASGDGGVQVAPLVNASFDSVVSPPGSGWYEDQPDGDDDNADIDTVFEKVATWYEYDSSTHVVSPSRVVYVVKSDRGAFFKVRIEAYYDPAGTPANLTLRWAPLP